MPDGHSSETRPWLIGMLHCPPLPGSPQFAGSVSQVRNRVLADAEQLVSGGFQSLMLENFGDTPFFPDSVPPATTAHLTALAREIRVRYPHVELGVNVLRNDGCAALAIAHAVDAGFIRVNVLCGARVTDQGLLQGIACRLLRLRRELDATGIRILADVDVKHSAPVGRRPIVDEVRDAIERGHADAVIVSGSATGASVDLKDLSDVAAVAGEVPVLVGSGVTEDNVAALLAVADGAIVGSSLKVDGRASSPVDSARIQRLLSAVT